MLKLILKRSKTHQMDEQIRNNTNISEMQLYRIKLK